MGLAVNDALTSVEDKNYLFPIRFGYDYIGKRGLDIKSSYLKMNDHMKSLKFLQTDYKEAQDQSPNANLLNANAIEIHPLAAGLPLSTGLQFFWQTKHWKAALKMTTELLEEFAKDKSAGETFKPNGLTFASTAKTEIPTVEDGFAKFPLYMYPHADEQRLKLLAAVNVYVFVLDESKETHDKNAVVKVQNDFVSRLLPQNGCQDRSKSSLQILINSTIQGFHDQDKIAANGGQQVVDRMVDFINHSPPKQSFQTLNEYLEYRRKDVAMPFAFACIKFSIKSSVDIDSPKFERFEYLVSNHVSINNDIASWKKEKLAYDSGKTFYLINTVDVVGRLMGLNEHAAITMSYVLQLETERQIDAELEHWMVAGILDEKEWQFVDAALRAMTGNVICSSIFSRYGGEASKL